MKRITRFTLITLFLLSAIVAGLAARVGVDAMAAPIEQGIQRFKTIYVNTIQANGASVVTINDGLTVSDAVTLNSTLTVTGDQTAGGNFDLNGNDLIMDPDGDTTVDSATDDQIVFTIAGTEVASMTVNATTITSGTLDMNAQAISNIGAAGTDFGSSGGLTLADNLTVTSGGATVSSGGLTVSAGLTVLSGGLNCTPQTEAITGSFVLTPTSCILSLTSTVAATSSTTTGIVTSTATSGDIIILSNNNASDVITLDGTGGTVECKADVALGAGDTLGLWYNGVDLVWNCLFNYDNS